jgi:hypothetical protein
MWTCQSPGPVGLPIRIRPKNNSASCVGIWICNTTSTFGYFLFFRFRIPLEPCSSFLLDPEPYPLFVCVSASKYLKFTQNKHSSSLQHLSEPRSHECRGQYTGYCKSENHIPLKNFYPTHMR